MQKRDLKGSTVVITGASSGIGRAAALAFAGRGAHVVVAARREEVLDDLAKEIEMMGMRALSVPTDVSDPHAVHELARKAAESFGGRIDVWFSDAGVGAVGGFREVPLAIHDQVIRTNLLGCMHGAYAVLPYFKRQESGVLIHMNSAGAFLPTPYSAAYSASKFGLRGFSEALRAELQDFPGIKICDAYAGFVNTTGFEHAANYIGKEISPAKMGMSPIKVAEAIVNLAENPAPRKIIGWSVYLARASYVLAPALSVALMKRGLDFSFKHASSTAVTEGHILTTSSKGQRIFGVPPKTRSRALFGAALSALGLAIIARGIFRSSSAPFAVISAS